MLAYVEGHKAKLSNSELFRILFIILFKNIEVLVSGCKAIGRREVK